MVKNRSDIETIIKMIIESCSFSTDVIYDILRIIKNYQLVERGDNMELLMVLFSIHFVFMGLFVLIISGWIYYLFPRLNFIFIILLSMISGALN